MKDQVKVLNRAIATAEEKLARIGSEKTKLTEQCQIAQREASEPRSKAGQVAALAVIGDDCDDDARDLSHRAHITEARATDLARTLTGSTIFALRPRLRCARRAKRKQPKCLRGA